MNPITIPKNYLNKHKDFYINYIRNSKTDFRITLSNIQNIINSITKNNNIKNSDLIVENFLYFVYRFIDCDNEYPNLKLSEGGVPLNGIEMYNFNTRKYLSIYHIHLSEIDKSVILWYIKFNKNGFTVQFEYLKHPDDDYKSIIEEIYNRNDDGYNFSEGDYFKNLKNITETNIKEKFIFIKTFEKFCNFFYK